MTTRNFEALFAPRRIALIGAGGRPGSVGAAIAANLLGGGFEGEILFVDPKGGFVGGHPVATTIQALPAAPDLAVIATPAATIPPLVAELGARGCRAAVVISAGFEGEEAASLRRALMDAARPHLLRLVGPNCLGFLSPAARINASFARLAASPGGVALVAQSGAVAAAALDAAPAHGVGFSHVVALGDSLDVDAGDLLDFLGRDAATHAILMYVESLGDARKFMSAARFAARAKPVIVLKGGRSAAGATAAFSHTRALAGADAVYSAAFRRAGVLQVDGLEALLAAGRLFARGRGPEAAGLAVLTNGGGAGVLAVDALEPAGGRLARLSPETQAALREGLPDAAACGNPVDVLGDAGPDRYRRSLDVLLQAPEVSAVLALNCPTAVADSGAAADAVISGWDASGRRKPLLGAWLGGDSVAAARGRLDAAGVPNFDSPEAAAKAFGQIIGLQRLEAELLEAPDGAPPPGAERARALAKAGLEAGRAALTPIEIDAVLGAYGVPRVPSMSVQTPGRAAAAAAHLGYPTALKIRSPDVTHKSDVGGVRLGLTSSRAVVQAARAMRTRLRQAFPKARLDGFLVQPMVVRPLAQEILAGVVRDPTFGPVVVVGHGGVAVEAWADRALGLPPLNRSLARQMIERTRVSRLLAGFRDHPAADIDALADLLVALGQLALDVPEIAELDLNPVLSDAGGVIVLDARIALKTPDPQVGRPAILAYPADLAGQVTIGGEALTVRPIRPRDVDGLIAMVDACDPEDVRLRFCAGLRHLDRTIASRLAQIDYDRHMAFVAETADGALVGVGRLVEDPPGDSAEFALMVRSDHQHRGLGHCLLQTVLAHADRRGLAEVWGEVARENHAMLDVARQLGFAIEPSEDDPTRVFAVRRRAGPIAASA